MVVPKNFIEQLDKYLLEKIKPLDDFLKKRFRVSSWVAASYFVSGGLSIQAITALIIIAIIPPLFFPLGAVILLSGMTTLNMVKRLDEWRSSYNNKQNHEKISTIVKNVRQATVIGLGYFLVLCITLFYCFPSAIKEPVILAGGTLMIGNYVCYGLAFYVVSIPLQSVK